MANKLAKKGNGVCVLATAEAITAAVNSYPLEDLWGVGGAYAKKIQMQGIKTAGELREQLY